MRTSKFIRFISFILAMLLLTATAFANAKGDVDNKGGVTVEDARLALRAAVKLETLTGDALKAADVDGKDGVTVEDARLILRVAVKLEEFIEEHVHQFVYKSDNEGKHYGECSCGEKTKKENCDYTYTAKGSNSGYHTCKCKVCGYTEDKKCTLGTEKNYSGAKEPTCTSGVVYYYTCTLCGGKRVYSEKKLGHNYVDFKSNNDATCVDGTKTGKCSRCGKTVTVTDEGSAKGHTLVANVDANNNVTYKCSICNSTDTLSAYNSIVNRLKKEPHSFTSVLVNKTSNQCTGNSIKISSAFKTLAGMMSVGLSKEEKEQMEAFLDEKKFQEMLTNEMKAADGTDFSITPSKVTVGEKNFNISGSKNVSSLVNNDVISIKAEKVSSIDILKELPDSVTIKNKTYSLNNIKANTTVPGKDIYKFTVVLKTEKYSAVKDSDSDTALMHATGVDIRELADEVADSSVNMNSEEDGMEMTSSCDEIVSDCTVVYYICADNSAPICARYTSVYDCSNSMSIDMSLMGIQCISGTMKIKMGENMNDWYFFDDFFPEIK